MIGENEEIYNMATYSDDRKLRTRERMKRTLAEVKKLLEDGRKKDAELLQRLQGIHFYEWLLHSPLLDLPEDIFGLIVMSESLHCEASGIIEHVLTRVLGGLSSGTYTVFLNRLIHARRSDTGDWRVPDLREGFRTTQVTKLRARQKVALLRASIYALEGLIDRADLRLMRMLAEVHI